MSDFYHLLEFHDDNANERANELLKKGWTLVHVGTRMIDVINNDQAYYNTEYVLGGTKEQYQQYEKEMNELIDEFDNF